MDLISTEAWEDLGDELKKNFSGDLFLPEASVQLRSYKGAGHAGYEAAQTLNLIFPHKRAVGYIRGLSPAFEFLIPQFLKEALTVQNVEGSQMGDALTWVDGLKKDTNFVLMAEDHPVTGEIFNTGVLDQVLNEKKIFSIRVSHARHFYICEEVRPVSARILSFGPELAITVFGSRFKPQSFTSAQMGWEKSTVLNSIHQQRKRIFDQSLVENFENAFSPWKYFVKPRPRLYDRAVLVFPEINGDALVNDLSQSLSLDLSLGREAMATTSPCSWQNPVQFKSWWRPMPTPEQIRGLVVFSAEMLARKDFAKLVKTSYERVMKLQSSFL